MKKLVLIGILILAVSGMAEAQWGGGIKSGGIKRGNVIVHKNLITEADFWYESGGPNQISASAIELAGYEKVRADFDLSTGTAARYNLMCSNDSLWVSGSSTEVVDQTWTIHELMGCTDYVFYIESLWPPATGDDTLTIYLTPYNQD